MIPRASSGDPIRIPAYAYNMMAEAAEAHARTRASQGTRAKADPPEWDMVLVRNDTGVAMSRLAVVGLGDAVFAPTGLNRILLSAVTPTAAHSGRFGILYDGLEPSAVGRAIVGGLYCAQVGLAPDSEDPPATTYTRADVYPGSTAKLAGNDSSGAVIVWQATPDEAGDGMAVLLFSSGAGLPVKGDARWTGSEELVAGAWVKDEQFEPDTDGVLVAKHLHSEITPANTTDTVQTLSWYSLESGINIAGGTVSLTTEPPPLGNAALVVKPYTEHWDATDHSRVFAPQSAGDTRYLNLGAFTDTYKVKGYSADDETPNYLWQKLISYSPGDGAYTVVISPYGDDADQLVNIYWTASQWAAAFDYVVRAETEDASHIPVTPAVDGDNRDLSVTLATPASQYQLLQWDGTHWKADYWRFV